MNSATKSIIVNIDQLKTLRATVQDMITDLDSASAGDDDSSQYDALAFIDSLINQ